MPDQVALESRNTISDNFSKLATRFESIAAAHYTKATHIAKDLGRYMLTAGKLLVRATKAGFVTGWPTHFVNPDRWGKQFEDEEEHLRFFWIAAIGSWLEHDYPTHFGFGAGELDWTHRRRMPEGSIVCIEKTDWDDADRLNHRRARARSYADACRLLARLVDDHDRDPHILTDGPQSDLISLVVACERFKVARSTLLRAIKAGKLTSRRPPGGARNARHFVSEAVVGRLYPSW